VIDSWIVRLLHSVVHPSAEVIQRVRTLRLSSDVGELVRIASQIAEFFGGTFAKDERDMLCEGLIILMREKEILHACRVHIAKRAPIRQRTVCGSNTSTMTRI
jgi:hypothetical protein